MEIRGAGALVTGAASGLGRATAQLLVERGARVTLLDLPASDGERVAAGLGPGASFAPADVTDADSIARAVERAAADGPLRILVHCAGRGGTVRVLDRDGIPGSLETYETIVRTNLVGTFNILRLAAQQMARADEADGERGVCVLTASIAAYEGQVGQAPYASSKAGVVGLTLVAARDLARRKIRVCTIAPGVFDTPMLARLGPDAKQALAATVPHPARLGQAADYALLAEHIVRNPMLNGETIRLDGALRMGAR